MGYYSNVTMPEKPEYDILSYPFSVAVFRYAHHAQDWSEVRLYYSATAFCYDSELGGVTNPEAVSRFQSYRAGGDSWSGEQTETGAPVLVSGLGQKHFQRIWTAQLLADEQDRVYLAAGAVTSPDWGGLGSWMAGVLQGMSMTPFRAVATGAPVFEPKYRYNGLVLPGLPGSVSSQKYVVIAWVPTEECYRAWGGQNIRIAKQSMRLDNSASVALTFYLSDYDPDTGWSEPRTQRVSKTSNITSYDVEPVWCNLDLIQVVTNELILAGSAPVQVVRIDPDVRYDPAVWTVGWYLGQRIAKGRRGTEVSE